MILALILVASLLGMLAYAAVEDVRATRDYKRQMQALGPKPWKPLTERDLAAMTPAR